MFCGFPIQTSPRLTRCPVLSRSRKDNDDDVVGSRACRSSRERWTVAVRIPFCLCRPTDTVLRVGSQGSSYQSVWTDLNEGRFWCCAKLHLISCPQRRSLLVFPINIGASRGLLGEDNGMFPSKDTRFITFQWDFLFFFVPRKAFSMESIFLGLDGDTPAAFHHSFPHDS